ncbi:BfmA/BtgA family mobilization protein [Bacteroides eggerthii]|nr:BfmA/BtgA family mobilization protein [Bacteroides eggerthii]
MDIFEVSGVTPQQITKQPIVQIQKRIEDVVKILRSYERDYFKQ